MSELVRIGNLVERDFSAAKAFRQRQNPAPTPKQMKESKKPNSLSIAQMSPSLLRVQLTLDHVPCTAVIDTGSTFSLITKTLWKGIKKLAEKLHSARGQTFSLANGLVQAAIGRCSLQRIESEVCLFIMTDRDLAFPCVLGQNFLMEINFSQRSYSIPEIEGEYFPLCTSTHDQVSLYVANLLPSVSDAYNSAISSLVSNASLSVAGIVTRVADSVL